MNWLVQNVSIDGIYLDDVAFDRVTMKRIKPGADKTATQHHRYCTQLWYNKSDGFGNGDVCAWAFSMPNRLVWRVF